MLCPPADREARMNEQRLILLETKLAYQEATLQSLNDAVARQQMQISQLEQVCRQLQGRLASLGEAPYKSSLSDEIPPHY
jgi:SlyX protein